MLKFPDSYINLSVSFHNLDINTNIKKKGTIVSRGGEYKIEEIGRKDN
jgi:hypothetical protein